MTVIILQRVPVKLRGELSRWLLEPRTGVFVGKVSALVRDKLWEHVQESCLASYRGARKQAGAVMLHRAQNEQGFSMRVCGDTDRSLVDYEGLVLVRTPAPEKPAVPSE